MAETAEKSRLERLADAEFPLEQLGAEVLLHLRRPFAPAAVKWKVQTEWGAGALVVGYIDARLVYERLNLVWPWWRPAFEVVQGGYRCTITLFDPDGMSARQIVRSDVGQGGDPKTQNSDAIKRAAVGLGVGVSIYALKQARMKVGSGAAELRTIEKNKKVRDQWQKVQVPVLDPRSEEWLAGKYLAWLEAKGTPLFGPVLDHGDEVGAQGLDSDSPAAAAAETGGEPVAEVAPPVAPEALQDDRALELRNQAEGLYGQFRRLKPRVMTPAAFQGKLRAAAGSHESLEALVEELEGLVTGAGGEG